MSSTNVQNLNDNENACVVCFKIVQIYSIGDCDHPVCYECSTRMRVLCKQNECPICRQDMTKVIFTKDVLPFKNLQNSTNLFDRKYRIAFMDTDIQTCYNELLEHNCLKCKTDNKMYKFKTFNHMKEHMRREHELHYCDLCVENLKIFSCERRCYTRSELAQHRRKGDADDKSHKGHPLCEFCDTRYMDSDELFRHLRRDHLYCHFCDADGFHHYYSSYDFLRQHFRSEHYLCEEGDCSEIEFTSVFRSEIDLKAHRASAHSRTIGKVAAKQARTLELEFTLAPRSRVDPNTRQPQRKYQNSKNSSREDRNTEGATGYDSGQNDPGPSTNFHNTTVNNMVKVTVDPLNSEDFPSLTNNGTSSINRPNCSVRNIKSSTGALARTKENFPALGPSSASQEPLPSSAHVRLSVHGGPSSAIIRNNNNKQNVSIHVSNRSNGSVTVPSKVKNTIKEDDFPSLEPLNYKIQGVAQKHKSLISNNYNSVSNPIAAPKISLIKRDQQCSSSNDVSKKVSINSAGDFPSLGNGSSAPQSSPQWLSSKPKKQSKVAPAPVLPKKQNFTDNSDFPTLSKTKQLMHCEAVTASSSSMNSNSSCSTNFTSDVKSTKNKKKKGASSDSRKENIDRSKNNTKINTLSSDSLKLKKDKSKETKKSEITIDSINSSKNMNNVTNSNSDSVNSSNNSMLANEKNNTSSISAPPGFSKDQQGLSHGNRINPPPGFETQETNNLTFISSSGQTYNILPGIYSYVQPNGFSHRNKILVECFQKALTSPSAMADFLEVSKLFREGILSAESFYENCVQALGQDFDTIFPELLVLLPDISKQQELYYIFKQNEKSKKKLEMCATCHQVLLYTDLKNHVLTHTLENHFPILGNEVPLQNVWKK